MLGFYQGVDEDNFVFSPELRFASAEYAQFRKTALEQGLDPDTVFPEDIMLFQTSVQGSNKGEMYTDIEFKSANFEYTNRLRWREWKRKEEIKDE